MRSFNFPSLLAFISILFFHSEAQARTILSKKAYNSSTSAIFVFGDSTVDPGNNNFIKTVFKSNFRPYGRDFVNHIPTGRFTDGRLVTDFIGSYLSIKEYIPPYLDSMLSLEELMTGVSFASAGSGYDPLTAKISSVIEMSKQMDYFKQYRSRVEHSIGKKMTDNLIKNAIYVVSAGTNDFIINYFTVPIRRHSYTVSGFQHFLILQVRQFIQDLLNQGARRIIIAGVPPMGCLPAVITLYSRNVGLQRDCIESYSSVARDYNGMLQNELNFMHNYLSDKGVKIAYADIYTGLSEMIYEPNKFGLDEVSSGCCGTGFLEAAFLCNLKSTMCPDASKYVFFDSIHPTERAYYILFKTLQPIIDFISKD